MTKLPEIQFVAADWDAIRSFSGTLVAFASYDGTPNKIARELDRLCGGRIKRILADQDAKKNDRQRIGVIGYPDGCAAKSLIIARLPEEASPAGLRRLGVIIGKRSENAGVSLLAGNLDGIGELALGFALGRYSFDRHKSDEQADETETGPITLIVDDPKSARASFGDFAAVAEGVYSARDFVNEPANVLTTVEFASRLSEYRSLGISVSILDEDDLRKIGMRTLLAVGQGSDSPSRVAILEWKGASAPTLALIGKGVVFDTGGISIKPSSGMEEMTMDMAGAATVAGIMRTLALRNSRSHVIGALGLVENMPGGGAQRPGDIVRSLKGDTVEVINTDAEGRLVLADLLWHVQESYKPSAMIDLATLTGAIIASLGDDLAGVFANDTDLAEAFMAAAEHAGEGAWRMPLHAAYDKQLKSRVADLRNVGGRMPGAITAAQFLKRFVKPDCPWMHMDIAGVAFSAKGDEAVPVGATGWGVQSIDQLIRDRFEAE